ncbi:sugar ABC transporter substrate-binding protein [Lentibacillus sediminis]|uniref:sugar ABC transporter substrate-binding protein n=1 Tax=Lentibacillus sediminis TaxID=1940529 RepID=UPI000C1BE995|nr:extracellular solute-binding protein [Lentibacillus sediminis]
MERKFKLFSLMAVLLLGMFLAACAPDRDTSTSEGNGEDSGESDETAEKPEELTIWFNDEEVQLAAIEEIVAKYEEQEGIQVNVEAVSMLDQVQELSLAGPEGNGPDLFFQPHDRIGNLVAQGLAEPLELTDEQLANYADAAVNAVTYNYDGNTQIYGVPQVIETYGLFYNTDIVSEAPETIEDLHSITEEHTNEAEEQYGFLMKPNDLYFAFPFFKNHGAYIFGGETGEFDTSDIGLNNEGAVEGGELFQSFFGSGLIPPATTADVIDGLFTEGSVGAVINGPWAISTYRDALGDSLSFAPFPAINGEPGQTFVGVKSWMVSYYSENKEWAQDLALFMTNQENLRTYFEQAGELPPNTDVLESLDDPIFSTFAEQIENGIPMPSTPQMNQVWEPMNNALQFIAEGDDVQAVLDEAVQQIETNIQASGAE